MRPVLLLLLITASCWSCKQKKVSLSGDEPVAVTDFVASFREIKLPYLVQDTLLSGHALDSMPVSARLIAQFVPDSVFRGEFPKGSKPKFHALGSVRSGEKETYLFLKASGAGKNTVYLLCFDEKPAFKAAITLLPATPVGNGFAEGGMDRRYSIIQNRFRKAADGQYQYRKNVFVYNSAGAFTLILTESNEQVENKEVYNPIDTLPRKGKWSADYARDKNNIVSIRDARRPNRVSFFVHFDRNEGECTGEMKGEAELVKPNLALYHDVGDHCELEFTFTATSVTLREVQGCGNHRGIKCFFEGEFPRRKEHVKAQTTPKSKQ
jgi:hypothetical protein